MVPPPAETSAPAPADARLVERWAADQSSASTRKLYLQHGERLLRSIGKPLGRVTEGDLLSYIEKSGSEAPASISALMVALRSLWAFRELHDVHGETSGDPTSALRPPKVERSLKGRIVSREEVVRLLDTEPSDRNRAMLALAYCAGFRRAELAALTWDRIVPRGPGCGTLEVGEGGRVVLLEGRAWEELVRLASGTMRSGPVFVSKKGGHMDPTAVWRVIKAAAARVGLPRTVTTQSLRSSLAVHSLQDGVWEEQLQMTLGIEHLDRYAKYAKSASRRSGRPS